MSTSRELQAIDDERVAELEAELEALRADHTESEKALIDIVTALCEDPRLAVPLDGPGSHRQDLEELRRVQAENVRLRTMLVGLGIL